MQRSYAIDVFRGLTITAMILVNNPGSWSHLYAPLAHASWHGWTVTDLIFPFFLIIVGISINWSFSLGSKAALTPNQQRQEIIIRSLKLYGLGLFLALFYYQFSNAEYSWINDRLLSVRLVGVLQRIAIVYLFSCVVFLYVKRSWHVAVAIGLLITYWLIMMTVPYPIGNGLKATGLLLPGNNLAAFIDHHLIGAEHLYLEHTKPFASDPEGLLSTLPAIASCIGGFLIADIMRQSTTTWHQVKYLLAMAITCLALAYISNLWIPFNKNLWTPSYVLLAQGMAGFVLAVIIYLTEMKNIRYATKPLVVFGMNAIALFVLSGIVARLMLMIQIDEMSLKSWLYQYLQLLPFEAKTQSLLFALCFLVLMYLPMYWMYQRRIFWKV